MIKLKILITFISKISLLMKDLIPEEDQEVEEEIKVKNIHLNKTLRKYLHHITEPKHCKQLKQRLETKFN